MVFIVYWCYGTQLSVNAAATADFFGTKNAGINYGMLFTAWGVAGLLAPRIGGKLYRQVPQLPDGVLYRGVLAAVALVAELLARRPKHS